MLKSPLYYEDVELGCKFRSPGGRTFTNAEVVNFAQITGDYNLVHIDHEFAKNSLYKENLVHGACVLALTGGMFKRTEFAVATAETLGELTGMKHIMYKAPVKFNDTIHLECEVLAKEELDEDTGLITLAFNGVNQNGEVTMDSVRMYRIARNKQA